MKKQFAGLVLSMFVSAIGNSAMAADKGTADEAIAMVKKAVAYIKANGPEKAYAEFNNPKGQFRDRDLYILVQDFNGKMLAHANPRLVGKDALEGKDADGKYLGKAMIEVAKEKGKGWVDYKWVNPTTSAVEQKSTYLEKVDNTLVACGIYK